MYIVYMHTSNISNKSYIGLTKHSIDTRWKQHTSEALNDRYNRPFMNAIRKYGTYDWTHHTLDVCDTLDEATTLEIHYIAKYDTYYTGYNATIGGEGGTIPCGIDHPLHGVAKTAAHISNWRASVANTIATRTEEDIARVSHNTSVAQRKSRGSKIYKFINLKSGTIVEGYVVDIAAEFGLHKSYLNKVAKGTKAYMNDWYLFREDGIYQPKYPIYQFSHPEYGDESLTLKDMATKYNLSRGNLSMVVTGLRKHTKGWVSKSSN